MQSKSKNKSKCTLFVSISDCSVSLIDGIFGDLPGAVSIAFWSGTDCEEHLFEMRYFLIVHLP